MFRKQNPGGSGSLLFHVSIYYPRRRFTCRPLLCPRAVLKKKDMGKAVVESDHDSLFGYCSDLILMSISAFALTRISSKDLWTCVKVFQKPLRKRGGRSRPFRDKFFLMIPAGEIPLNPCHISCLSERETDRGALFEIPGNPIIGPNPPSVIFNEHLDDM
jgi:hypothetical protein